MEEHIVHLRLLNPKCVELESEKTVSSSMHGANLSWRYPLSLDEILLARTSATNTQLFARPTKLSQASPYQLLCAHADFLLCPVGAYLSGGFPHQKDCRRRLHLPVSRTRNQPSHRRNKPFPPSSVLPKIIPA